MGVVKSSAPRGYEFTVIRSRLGFVACNHNNHRSRRLPASAVAANAAGVQPRRIEYGMRAAATRPNLARAMNQPHAQDPVPANEAAPAAPAADAPTADQPTADQPTADQPTADAPTADAPGGIASVDTEPALTPPFAGTGPAVPPAPVGPAPSFEPLPMFAPPPPTKPRKRWFAWLRDCPASLMVIGLLQLILAPLYLFGILPAILAIIAPLPTDPSVALFVGNDIESRVFWVATGVYSLLFAVLTIIAPYQAMKGSRLAARWFVASAWIQLITWVPAFYAMVVWVMPSQLREIDAMSLPIQASVIDWWYMVTCVLTTIFDIGWLIAVLWVMNRPRVRAYLDNRSGIITTVRPIAAGKVLAAPASTGAGGREQ